MISSPQVTACIDSGCVGHTGILRVREELAYGFKQTGETLGTCVCTGVLTMSKAGSMASSVGLTLSVCALGHTLSTSVHTGLPPPPG